MSDKNRPILVPTDFSPTSEQALLFAAELARKLGNPLTILHVVHDPGGAPGYYAVTGRNKQLRKMEDVATEMLDEFMIRVREKHPKNTALKKAATMLVVGLPVNRILESAEKINARMIIMGSQGRTGLVNALLGTKAQQVVGLAKVPVTIVKSEEPH